MYAKLAFNNAKKSVKDYLIYFITLTLCVGLFYAFASASSPQNTLVTEDMFNFDILQSLLYYSGYAVMLFLSFLVVYVNKYMRKRRYKEFATYILLGISQLQVSIMFFIETLLIGLLAIGTGILLGAFLAQLITAIILITAGFEVTVSLHLYSDTIIQTFIVFILLFLVIGGFQIKRMSQIKLIDMLYAEKKNDPHFKRSRLVYLVAFLIAATCFAISGYLFYQAALRFQNEEFPGLRNLIGLVSLFLVGIYAFFYSLSSVAVWLKEKWTSLKYEGTNMFLMGAIVSKIKSTPFIIGTITLTFLGATLCFTFMFVMAQWAVGYLEERIPFDIRVEERYSAEVEGLDIPYIFEVLAKNEIELEQYVSFSRYVFESEIDFQEVASITDLEVMKLSDFNRVRELFQQEPIVLDEDEFTMHWFSAITDEERAAFAEKFPEVTVGERVLTLSSETFSPTSLGEITEGIIIVPDEVATHLEIARTSFFAMAQEGISLEQMQKVQSDLGMFWIRIQMVEQNSIMNVSLFMRIFGIYLGMVMFMISLTVLSLQQLAESVERKDNYDTLKRLGLEKAEINRIVQKQIGISFIIPLIVAIIPFILVVQLFETAFARQIEAFIGRSDFYLNIFFSLLLVFSIYIVYYISTYYTFKRNISN